MSESWALDVCCWSVLLTLCSWICSWSHFYFSSEDSLSVSESIRRGWRETAPCSHQSTFRCVLYMHPSESNLYLYPCTTWYHPGTTEQKSCGFYCFFRKCKEGAEQHGGWLCSATTEKEEKKETKEKGITHFTVSSTRAASIPISGTEMMMMLWCELDSMSSRGLMVMVQTMYQAYTLTTCWY